MAATKTPESGTKDKNYDLITVTQLCLEHVWRLEQYADDAERDGDSELASMSPGCRSTAGAAPKSARSCSPRGSTSARSGARGGAPFARASHLLYRS